MHQNMSKSEILSDSLPGVNTLIENALFLSEMIQVLCEVSKWHHIDDN